MIKAVIFDFDGTLFDSMAIWDHIASDYLKTKGIEDRSITQRVANMSMDEALIYIKNAYCIADEISVMYNDVEKLLYYYYAKEAKPKVGVIEFIDNLYQHHIPMFILSASTRKLIEAALDHYHIKHYFHELYCCDELNLNKNNSQIFSTVIAKIGILKTDILIVEDAYHAIKAAKSIDLKVAGIYEQSEKRNIESLVDYYIQDFYEMEDYLYEDGINDCGN